MKIKIAFILACIVGFQAYSQEEDWYSYDLDSIVSLDMPGEVFEGDTIENNLKIQDLVSYGDSLVFYARKIQLGKEFYDRNGVRPPVQDRKSLIEFYQTFAFLTAETYNQENSISRPINFDNLKGYRFVLNPTEEESYLESQLVFVNEHMYVFQYANLKGLDSIERSNFFDSIYFDDTHELKQYKKRRTFLNGTTIGILMLFLVLSFYLKEKNKRRTRR